MIFDANHLQAHPGSPPHQALAHVIVPDDGQQAAMQDTAQG
jgi:hypothetical protein